MKVGKKGVYIPGAWLITATYNGAEDPARIVLTNPGSEENRSEPVGAAIQKARAEIIKNFNQLFVYNGEWTIDMEWNPLIQLTYDYMEF